MRNELAYSCTRLLASRWIGSRDVDSTLLKNTQCQKRTDQIKVRNNLEGQLPDEQLRRLLVPPDLLESHEHWLNRRCTIWLNPRSTRIGGLPIATTQNTLRATVPALYFLFFPSGGGAAALTSFFSTTWKQNVMDGCS